MASLLNTFSAASEAATIAALARSDPSAAAAIMKRKQIINIAGLALGAAIVLLVVVAVVKSPSKCEKEK